jgi:hypothetical protein
MASVNVPAGADAVKRTTPTESLTATPLPAVKLVKLGDIADGWLTVSMTTPPSPMQPAAEHDISAKPTHKARIKQF